MEAAKLEEVRWLVALEATLFLSFPLWEAAAPRAWPAAYPYRFAACVAGGAALAMIVAHVGPAMFRARFEDRVPGWLRIPLSAWLILGCCEWIGALGLTIRDGTDSNRTMLGFLAAVAAAAWTWPRSRIAVPILLTVAAGLLGWSIAVNFLGLTAVTPHLDPNIPPGQHEWSIVAGMLTSAAPAAILAWRMGASVSSPWKTGFMGVWLPAVVSVTAASLAVRAGATLHWPPSLMSGFYWALNDGQGLDRMALAIAELTMLGPAIVAALALRRRLLPPLLIASPFVAFYSVRWLPSPGIAPMFSSEFHSIWCVSLLMLGGAAFIAAFAKRRDKDRGMRDRNWSAGPVGLR